MTGTRPAIPLSLAERPTTGGLACPFVNVELAGGGVDFRAVHQARFAACWDQYRCQTCGSLIAGTSALLGPLDRMERGHFTEPPVCLPCLQYSSRACPMLGGRMDEFPDRDRVSEGRRGAQCSTPGCDCGGWRESDPDHSQDHRGDPSHPYYAAFIRSRSDYVLTVHETETVCSDKGCRHKRMIVNGGQLLHPPLKVVLVSVPAAGRVWRTLPADEVKALTAGITGRAKALLSNEGKG